jgi:4-carboxymuconolactone decarboxylase
MSPCRLSHLIGQPRRRTLALVKALALSAFFFAAPWTLALGQEAGVTLAQQTGLTMENAQMQDKPTQGQRLFGDIAPKFAELTDDVLFGDVWARPGLSPRERSLATISALIAMNRPDQLRAHLAIARKNGLTEQEMIEAITHLAFYAGWPSAVTAISVAREVFEK